MTNVADAAPVPGQAPPATSLRDLIAQTEIDLRLFGMLIAFVVILVTFNVISGGKFFLPNNMVTLACRPPASPSSRPGMVLVIVSRNIDLSVGSLVGVIAMTYALLMTDILPDVLGLPADFPFRWAIALAIGIALGAAIGALQGFIIAYIGVPSFIVTLGGLLSIRGVVWYLSSGAAVSGLDANFQLLGGGARARLAVHSRGYWPSSGRGHRRVAHQRSPATAAFRFPVRPMWAEVLIGVVGCVIVIGVANFANNNFWPQGLADRVAAQENWGHRNPRVVGASRRVPNPLILLLGVTLVMTWLATRRRPGATCTPSAATPTPPSWRASTPAARS